MKQLVAEQFDAEERALLGLPPDGGKRFPGRKPSATPAANLPRGSSADHGLLAVKKRAAAAQAEKLELQNARFRGELVAASEVEREWTSILRDVRAAFLSLPSRMQQQLLHLSAHDVAVLDREVRGLLADLGSAGHRAGQDAPNDPERYSDDPED